MKPQFIYYQTPTTQPFYRDRFFNGVGFAYHRNKFKKKAIMFEIAHGDYDRMLGPVLGIKVTYSFKNS